MSTISSINPQIKELVFHIEKQQCLLFLGPEILKIKEISYQQSFLSQLVERQPSGVKFRNEKDGLLIFNTEDDRNMVDFVLAEARSSLETPDFTLLDKLIAIPFSAVLSVNADDFYYQRLKNLGYNADTAFFRGRLHGQSHSEKKPTPNTPLIYNLFGSFEEHESMILDYTDLNKFLKSMMSLSESGLPNVVSDLLMDAKAFIFCGFEFNKWYSQLLLRLLTKGAQKKFVIKETSIESSSKVFLEKGFAVNFLEADDGDVVDALVQMFTEKGTIRKQKAPPSKEQSDLDKIRDFIEADTVMEALDFMEILGNAKNDQDIVNTVVIQKGRISEIIRDKNAGTLTADEFKAEKNKIREAVLSLAQELCSTN
jgi:hypothetical protein